MRVQSIGRGFLARLRVRRQVEREQAENLALLHQGSQAEVALESGTLRYAQVVTAQRLVRGVLTRKRLAEAAERAEADTVATLQRGSEAERKVAAKRWQRLREERGRQEAAVCYMQALVRGHLTRRTTTHRHLPDDDGDFSEAEADDDEADDSDTPETAPLVSINAAIVDAGLARVRRPRQRRGFGGRPAPKAKPAKGPHAPLQNALVQLEEKAHKNHVGMWRYGDPGDSDDARSPF